MAFWNRTGRELRVVEPEIVKGPRIPEGARVSDLRPALQSFSGDRSITSSFVQTARNFVTGIGRTIFSPEQPLPPQVPAGTRPRLFNYTPGYNLNTRVRPYEPVSFTSLRALARNCDIMRTIIQTRKDQIMRIKWDVQYTDPDRGGVSDDPRYAELMTFFKLPDGKRPFHRWLRRILEDLFVIDAISIEVVPSVGGKKPGALRQLDGSTIKFIIDDTGDIPAPPDPAYQQVINGLPWANFTAEELLYCPMNERVDSPLGYSPVEQTILTVEAILRRETSVISYFTEGSIPDAIIGTPDNWTPDQIADTQALWDAYLEGNLGNRRKMRFVPGGMKATVFKEPALKAEIDEWFARILCFALSIPPTPFIRQMNRATAESAADEAIQEGLLPTLEFLKNDIFLPVIQSEWGFGYDDLELYPRLDKEIDAEKQGKIYDLAVRNGTMTINKIRDQIGEDAIEGGDDAFVVVGQNIVLVKHLADTSQAALDSAQGKAKSALNPPEKVMVGPDGSPAGAPPTNGNGKNGAGKKTADKLSADELVRLVSEIERRGGVVLKKKVLKPRSPKQTPSSATP